MVSVTTGSVRYLDPRKAAQSNTSEHSLQSMEENSGDS